MNLEINDLLEEINKFKANVSSSNSLVNKIEGAIDSIKQTQKDNEESSGKQLKITRESLEEIGEESKKVIKNAKEYLDESKEKLENSAKEIISKCDEVITTSKEALSASATKIKDIEEKINTFEKRFKKQNQIAVIGGISLGIICIATLIVSIISLVI